MLNSVSDLESPQPIAACSKRHYTVTRLNLPLCCPMPDMVLWNAHPRVYLPIEKLGKVTCPYCDAVYELVDEEAAQPVT